MCMMKRDGSGERESCEVARSLAALDGRVTKVEGRLDKMEGSLNDGFRQLSTAVNTLGHDFGERMNLIEKKVVDEKTAWGECFRKWLGWIVRLLIVGCGAAMGMTAYKMIFGS